MNSLYVASPTLLPHLRLSTSAPVPATPRALPGRVYRARGEYPAHACSVSATTSEGDRARRQSACSSIIENAKCAAFVRPRGASLRSQPNGRVVAAFRSPSVRRTESLEDPSLNRVIEAELPTAAFASAVINLATRVFEVVDEAATANANAAFFSIIDFDHSPLALIDT